MVSGRDSLFSVYALFGYFLYGHNCGKTDSYCPKYILWQGPLDIRSEHGVRIEKLPGSRVAYDPFPGGFYIKPGGSITVEFKTTDPTGLILLIGNLQSGDMVAANLAHGFLTFIRKCGRGKAVERYTKLLNNGRWHSLRYTHNKRGGELEIDGWNPFQNYHLGPCSDFSSVLFGGLTPELEVHSWRGHDGQHRFKGCLRNMRIDGKIPMIHPTYVAVSVCDENDTQL